MSDTPDVPRGRGQEGCHPSEAELLATRQDTPTVEFRGRPGKGNPLRIEAPPTPGHSRNDPTDSAIPSPLAADVPPELANHPRYRVIGTLGKGGMGTVFKAEHRVMKRFVALKVIGVHLVAEPAALARFRREVEAAAKLSHPNIVTAYDAEQAGNCHFLVMELVDGISFDLVLKRYRSLPLVFACDYIRQAALGLQHAHEHRMVHRDIKLQNLMLTRKGLVKILDFGLARFASETGPTAPLTECGALTGTPDFMSPEQAEDARSADIRADLYSLGCTFYTLLTGQLPFPTGSYVEKIVGHLKKEPTPLTCFRSDLPPELVQIVGRMMAKDPAQRFQTPDEVANALLGLSNTEAATPELALAMGKDEGSIPSSVTGPESPPASVDVADATEDNTTLSSQSRTENIQTSDDAPFARSSKSHLSRRRKRPSSGKTRKPVVASAVIGVIGLVSLVCLLLVALLRGGTNKKERETLLPPSPDLRADEQGRVMVVSRDPHLQLAIRSGTKNFGTIGPNSKPDLVLPAGEYELQVVDSVPELRGFSARFSLARGDRKVVEVRREGVFVRDYTGDFPPPPYFPGGPPLHPPPRFPSGPPPHPPPFGGPPRP